MYVPNFKILGQVVPEKALTKVSIFITLKREIEKGKNRKTRQKLFSEPWLCFQKYTYLSSLCIQNLKILALIDAELIKWKKILERKKNGQIKVLISNMRLIL